jgi:AraC family transcriptional regulator of adaptative response/methylated-DNA-[protein]-cysteine methyltransferase
MAAAISTSDTANRADERWTAAVDRVRRAAESNGESRAARAVAMPCHRVVRSDGTLSGRRWGTELKAELLRREA